MYAARIGFASKRTWIWRECSWALKARGGEEEGQGWGGRWLQEWEEGWSGKEEDIVLERREDVELRGWVSDGEDSDSMLERIVTGEDADGFRVKYIQFFYVVKGSGAQSMAIRVN